MYLVNIPENKKIQKIDFLLTEHIEGYWYGIKETITNHHKPSAFVTPMKKWHVSRTISDFAPFCT